MSPELLKSLAAAADIGKQISQDVADLETKLTRFKSQMETAHPLLTQAHLNLLTISQAEVTHNTQVPLAPHPEGPVKSDVGAPSAPPQDKPKDKEPESSKPAPLEKEKPAPTKAAPEKTEPKKN
jgi:hypothetical protein